MNYTQEELKGLQAINSLKESELGTRVSTTDELQAFFGTIQELWEKGFVVSKDNFLKLWMAFDANPNIPINRGNILETAKVYRDQYAWKSAADQEFRKLSDSIGPDKTALVTRELGRHGLVNAQGSEDLFNNFNAVIHFYQSQGWQISAQNFEQAIGNLRTSLGHDTLVYKPTPSQQASAKRWENTRNSESNTEYKNFTKTTKSLLQIAKEKAAMVAHIVNPDGTRMSDQIMREFYEAHPEALETEAPHSTTPPLSPDEAYWKKQTSDYVRSIASNLIQSEAEAEVKRVYEQQKSWRATLQFLHNWYGKRAPGRPQR